MQHPVIGTGVDTPFAQAHPGNATAAALAAKYLRQAISYAVPRDQIVGQLLNGYGIPAITTPVVGNYKTGIPLTEGFNTALHPYAFNLTKASELIKAAGYVPATPAPGFFEAYGLYLTIALVAAIVALAGVFVWRTRRKPVTASTMTSQPSMPTNP